MIPVRTAPFVAPILATERRFNLTDDHPLYGTECPACGGDLLLTPLVLVLVGRAPLDNKRWCAAGAVAVHEACAVAPSEQQSAPAEKEETPS